MVDVLEVFIDGASKGNPGPAGIGIYIPKFKWVHNEYIGETTNNVAEARALLLAFEICARQKYILSGTTGPKYKYIIHTDSELIHKHMSGEYKVKDKNLGAIYAQIPQYANQIEYELKWIAREENKDADRLASLAAEQAGGVPERKMPTENYYYQLHHDHIYHIVHVLEFNADKNGKRVEGMGASPKATFTEESVIQTLLAIKEKEDEDKRNSQDNG